MAENHASLTYCTKSYRLRNCVVIVQVNHLLHRMRTPVFRFESYANHILCCTWARVGIYRKDLICSFTSQQSPHVQLYSSSANCEIQVQGLVVKRRGGQPLLYEQRRYRCRSLLNLVAALPQSFLNKNSSKLSLPLFATAPFAAREKVLVLFYRRKINFEKPNLEMFFCKKLLKKKRDLKKIVIEHLGHRKNYFTVHTHTNETQTAQTHV